MKGLVEVDALGAWDSRPKIGTEPSRSSDCEASSWNDSDGRFREERRGSRDIVV